MNAIGSHIRHNATIVSDCRVLLHHGMLLTKYGHLSGWERCYIAARGSCHAIPSHVDSIEVECKVVCRCRGRGRRRRMSNTMTADGECQSEVGVGCDK